jgi:hypothetical protein
MPALVLLIVVIAVVLLLAKSFHDAQQARGEGGEPASARPAPEPRRRPSMSRPRRRLVIDEEKLADHAAKLRKAVEAGLVTSDEAVASIVRQTDGQLGEEAARQLLNIRDAA